MRTCINLVGVTEDNAKDRVKKPIIVECDVFHPRDVC